MNYVYNVKLKQNDEFIYFEFGSYEKAMNFIKTALDTFIADMSSNNATLVAVVERQEDF